MYWENINTEQRERKIYSRTIYIHEWVVSQKKSSNKTSQFSNLLQSIFKGVICLSFWNSFVPKYNEKAKLRSENDSKLNMFFWLKSEEIANMRKKSAKL